MTIFTGTASTFDLRGIREDLTNVIWNVSPMDTPFSTKAQRAKATSTLHEWQTDALRTAVTSNAHIQGDDIASVTAVVATTRLGNHTQIAAATVGISGSIEAVIKAGRGSELAYQISKMGKEVRRDIESQLVGSNQAKVVASAGVSPKTADMLSWIKTNTDKDATSGADPGTADGTAIRTDSSATRAFTPTQLNGVLKGVYTNSGDPPEMVMLPPAMKQAASTFTGNVTRTQDTSDKRLVSAIDYYTYDFGTVQMVPNRFMRTRDVLVVNTDLWAVAWLRPMRVEDLAKTGDANKKMIVAEYALESRNEKGSGGIFDLA